MSSVIEKIFLKSRCKMVKKRKAQLWSKRHQSSRGMTIFCQRTIFLIFMLIIVIRTILLPHLCVELIKKACVNIGENLCLKILLKELTNSIHQLKIFLQLFHNFFTNTKIQSLYLVLEIQTQTVIIDFEVDFQRSCTT